MKNIISVFINDVKKICSQKTAIVIMLGILIIPGIYAWLNIDSNWNPYDNTENLPIAIVNKDTGVTILDKNINMGQMMVDALKENNAMKWIFTDEQTAKDNVEKSKYYGVIIIPENFSNKFVTLFDDEELQKPIFDFYINQKKNPIAPIIVDKAVSTIQTTLNQNFVNAIIYKLADTAGEMNFITKQAATTNELIQKLAESKENIIQLRAVLKTLVLASDSTTKSLYAIRDLLPSINNITGTTKKGISDMRDAAGSFSNSYEKLNNNISTIISDLKNTSESINNILNSTDTTNITENLGIISNKLNELERKVSIMQNSLNTIYEVVKLDGIESIIEKNQNILNEINDLQQVIENSNKTIDNIEELKTKINNLNEDISIVDSEYTNSVKSDLEDAYSNTSKSMLDITSVATRLDASLGKTDSALENMILSFDNAKELTDNIDIVLLGLQSDIDKIINTLSGEKEAELYNKIANILQNEPSVIADYLTTLVGTNEIDLYPIDSYGSKMTPFYTVLACWVGCTLLVSILKTDIKESKETEKLKNYQKFLGRFILFGAMAMLQGLIIGIGDIVLQVQVINMPLFLFTIMLSSIIFMLIVYSLTISFGKVGEALAIVFMVFQVAGSGGTFPIELLPRAFQVLQPFMPFYPAMNAIRETMGGFYENDFVIYIIQLLCHMIIPLLLGLGFRRRIIKLKKDVDESLEKTDIII